MIDRLKDELKRIGWEPDFDYDAEDVDPSAAWGNSVGDAVLELVEVFLKQGHSGASASYAASLFKNFVDGKPLSPLTGEDDEWRDRGEEYFQNKRCSHIFKDKDGAYDIRGWVFVEGNGSAFTNMKSRRKIEFPCIPETTYIDLEKYEDLERFNPETGKFDLDVEPLIQSAAENLDVEAQNIVFADDPTGFPDNM